MKKRVTIPYFHTGMKWVTPFMFGGCVFLAVNGYYLWAVLLVIAAFVILSTAYVTEINLAEKRYKDYITILGISVNEEKYSFTTLEKIVVTKGDYSQNINTRVQSRQLNWSDYTGTLVMDSNKTLDLLTRNEKRELLTGLKDFSKFLNVGVEDLTTSQPYWVDMDKIS